MGLLARKPAVAGSRDIARPLAESERMDKAALDAWAAAAVAVMLARIAKGLAAEYLAARLRR